MFFLILVLIIFCGVDIALGIVVSFSIVFIYVCRKRGVR